MAALRRNVFVEKVLKRLYAKSSCGQGKKALKTPASVEPPEKAAPETVDCQSVPPQADEGAAGERVTDPGLLALGGSLDCRQPGGSTAALAPGRRLYTVSLPPDGLLPVWPELPCDAGSPSSSSSEAEAEAEAAADQELHDQPKRRRIRKRKSKKTQENLSDIPAEKAELEKQRGLSWKTLQPCHTEGPTLSRNKKRKLKKKQQIKRKKAAGLLRKTCAMNFLYQPEEGSSEPGNEDEEAKPDLPPEVGPKAQEPGVDLEPEVGTEAPEEGVSRTDKKVDDILTFLKSTQELYFYDGATGDPELSVSMESAEQLLTHLETHGLPCSDVLILDHMKTLLFLEDTPRLKHALEVFPEHCLMPPDHARVISAFFSYWITHILPEKQTSSE
ncbi:glutamate-rich protein 1 [Sorex fumeus]|uniref:glutamate-rich protein 1 n=1 Tax=Sorex fumeus TaxID=62283 RepID=UPI0024AD22CC|nr:glutamate-rich protein 1 [Sorex fumeus]